MDDKFTNHLQVNTWKHREENNVFILTIYEKE